MFFVGFRKLQRRFLCHWNSCHQPVIQNAILPILTIIRDGKHQDIMIGRYQTQNLKTACQMWMCECSSSNVDSPNKSRTLLKETSITVFSGMALGFYKLKNASKFQLL